MAKAKHVFLRTIQEKKLQYFGHLIQGKGKEKLPMEWKIEGTRRRKAMDMDIWYEGLVR